MFFVLVTALNPIIEGIKIEGTHIYLTGFSLDSNAAETPDKFLSIAMNRHWNNYYWEMLALEWIYL